MLHFFNALFLLVLVKNIFSINIDTNFPIVYVDPNPNSNRSNYFGYSSVLHPGDKNSPPWIFIGSPRGQNSSNTFRNSGLCFKCGIKKNCTTFLLSKTANSATDLEGYNVTLDDAWIGGAMDINYKFDKILTCGFRAIKFGDDNKLIDFCMQGVCYLFNGNDNMAYAMYPFQKFGNTADRFSTGKYLYGQAQPGFSIHSTANFDRFLLGAPGVRNNKGTSILLEKRNDLDDFVIVNNDVTKGLKFHNLLGYSSSSGVFYSDRHFYYVSGAPRGSNYRGLVMTYQIRSYNDDKLTVRERKNGSQVGEYFGASLAAGDINNDGRDDLIIGAPMFKGKNYNEGKVYIFKGGQENMLQKSEGQVIIGKKTNGHFGLSVQYLGDIDHDGYGDVAVSAPYEEDTGVVYIYQGSAKGLNTVESQRIVGKEVFSELRGFGLSISRSLDIDDNRYLDVAIGAPISGHIVILRTRPLVTIYQSMTPSTSSLSLTKTKSFQQTSFSIKACFWYKLNYSSYNITINTTLIIDKSLGRANLSDYSNEVMELEANKSKCKEYSIKLTRSHSVNLASMVITLTHHFEEKHSLKKIVYISNKTMADNDSFCSNCPIYDDYRSINVTTLSIPLYLGCKGNKMCNARLQFDPKIINLRSENVFVIGSIDDLLLETKIENLGEMAYSTQLEVTIPEKINFRIIPTSCGQNLSTILCNVADALETNGTELLQLSLDVSALNERKYHETTLTIVVTVLTKSKNSFDNQKVLKINLVREVDVIISGKSREQSYSIRNALNNQIEFDQTYQIEKIGPSSLDKVLVEIDIPYIFKTKNGKSIEFLSINSSNYNGIDQDLVCESNFDKKDEFVRIESDDDGDKRQIETFNKSTTKIKQITNDFDTLSTQIFYINCSMSEVICSKIQCTIDSIENGKIADIYLRMLFKMSAIKDLLGKKDMVVYATRGSITIPNVTNLIQNENNTNTIDVISLLIGETVAEQIALWIILLSAVVGMLLFLLSIVGLIKFGFFKRKTKEQLNQLKKEMEMEDTSNIQEEEDVGDVNVFEDVNINQSVL